MGLTFIQIVTDHTPSLAIGFMGMYKHRVFKILKVFKGSFNV